MKAPNSVSEVMGEIPETIAIMARTAREAAELPNFHAWAQRLAAKAPTKNYIEQLRAIYHGILSRWRYVQENGEWVPGTARALIGVVLGVQFNTAEDPTTVDITATPAHEKGYGDCDDVSTLVAAAALTIGMRPIFRVTRGRISHVSVLVVTPNGVRVSLDPVGAPNHDFGWMVPATSQQITLYDVNGRQMSGMSGVRSPGCRSCCPVKATAIQNWDGKVRQFAANPYRTIVAQGQPHPRALAVPRGFLSAITCTDGLCGVDEHGREFFYDGLRDAFVQNGLEGIADIKRRWKKRIKKVRKVVKKVANVNRAIQAKILKSKVAQNLVGAVLQVYGVPFPATKGILQAAGSILQKGGLAGLLKMLKKNPKAAMQLVAKAAKEGLISTGMVPAKAKQYLSGVDDFEPEYQLSGCGRYLDEVQPLAAIVELDGVPDYQAARFVGDTDKEKNNVSVVMQMRPNVIGKHKRKSGQSDSDWFTDAALFATYKNAPTPLTSVYKKAWVRINGLVKGWKGTPETTPTTVPSTTTASTSTKAATVKPASKFVLNPNEHEIFLEVIAEQPTSAMTVEGKKSINPKDKNQLANAAYYRAYPDGPVKIGTTKARKPWADAWKRAKAIIDAQAKNPVIKPPVIVPVTPPKTDKKTETTDKIPIIPPVIVPKTTDCWDDMAAGQSRCVVFERHPREAAIVDEIFALRPKSWNLDGNLIYQGTKSDVDWLTNIAYWAAYRDGPRTIVSSAPSFAAAWNRQAARMKAKLAAQTTPDDLPDVPDVPDDPPKPKPIKPIIPPGPHIDPIPPGPHIDPIPPGPGPGPGMNPMILAALAAGVLLIASRK